MTKERGKNEKRERNQQKGSTLIETLVSLGVFGIFLTFLLGLYVWGYQSWKKAEVKLNTQRDGSMCFLQMSKDLRQSNESSISVIYYTSLDPFTEDTQDPPTGNCAVSFLSAYDSQGEFQTDSSTLLPTWQSFIIYYYDYNDKTVKRKILPLTSIGKSPTTSVYTLSSLADVSEHIGEDGKIMCQWVTQFQLLDPTAQTEDAITTPSGTVRVKLVMEKITHDADNPEILELYRLIRVSN